jgi:hypothetical protein
MLDFLQNNYAIIIAAVIVIGGGLFAVIKEPERIKEWLVWACAKAEESLGAGTGELKLRLVYDMFICQFPLVSKIIPFSVFVKWTEMALEKFEDWLTNNEKENSFLK